jgi:hypothetical protein
MDFVTWCNWINFVLNFFVKTLLLQNKTKMNAQHNTHLGRCLFGDISIIVQCNFAFKSSITTIGSNWTIWWVLASLKQLHMPEWLQMVEQVHVSQQPQKIMYLLIIYYFDMIFSLIFCLNSHYIIVQQGTTLLKFSHNLTLFPHYEIFLYGITYFEQKFMFTSLLNYKMGFWFFIQFSTRRLK